MYLHNSVYINIIFITGLKPTILSDCIHHSKLYIILTSDVYDQYILFYISLYTIML